MLRKKNEAYGRSLILLIAFLLTTLVTACSPTVKIEAPDKPIVVNMNIKIEHKLKVKIKKDVNKTIADNPDIF